MKNIREFFVNEVMPNFNSIDYNVPYIPFIFDDETIDELYTYLNNEDEIKYEKAKKYLDYLKKIKEKQEEDNIYVPVHNSYLFFNLLQELVKNNYGNPKSLLTYIWLRMGVDDIRNVEKFLMKQISFLKNDRFLDEYKEILSLGENRVLAYRIYTNKPYFESDRRIEFSIRETPEDIFDLPKDYGFQDIYFVLTKITTKDYRFPGIYFGLTKENNIPTCYIYSIQNLTNIKDKKIKEYIQPICKQLRNKYVSADFLIAISLFLDFLYDNNIVNIVIPTLQVFNYPYHKQLSDTISSYFDSYSEEEKKQLEELYEKGDKSDKVEDYIYTKEQASRFVNKEDSISHNKTERLINMFYEIQQIFNSFNIVCEPFIQGENLVIHLNKKNNIFEGISTHKKRK